MWSKQSKVAFKLYYLVNKCNTYRIHRRVVKATFPHMTNSDNFLGVWELQSKRGNINKWGINERYKNTAIEIKRSASSCQQRLSEGCSRLGTQCYSYLQLA